MCNSFENRHTRCESNDVSLSIKKKRLILTLRQKSFILSEMTSSLVRVGIGTNFIPNVRILISSLDKCALHRTLTPLLGSELPILSRFNVCG